MTTVILIVLFWLACGFVSVRIGMAFSKGHFPSIWEESYTTDLLFFSAMGLVFGPVMLVIGFFFFERAKYGWRLRP